MCGKRGRERVAYSNQSPANVQVFNLKELNQIAKVRGRGGFLRGFEVGQESVQSVR